MFDENYKSSIETCHCCYSCISRHANDGCEDCLAFIDTFFKKSSNKKRTKSVIQHLKYELNEIFAAMRKDYVFMEDHPVPASSFVQDFLSMSDEISSAEDIVNLWHIETNIAYKVYAVYSEFMSASLDDKHANSEVVVQVVPDNQPYDESFDSDDEDDFPDDSTSSESD